MIPFFFFLFGIVIGSFLNVCISRIPEGLSVVAPGSRCPRCKQGIKPYDNIPILSWFLLGGKCRNCHLPISVVYPIVEALTGILFVLTYYSFGLNLASLKYLVFACLMIVLMMTDVLERILPDAVNWFGFCSALLMATFVPPDGFAIFLRHGNHITMLEIGMVNALLGAALGSLVLWGAAALYKLVRKREGMGMGDVKMMGMVGAFLGVRGAFLTILIGTFLGSIIGIAVVVVLYLFGWRRKLAERAHRRGLGTLSGLRWTLAAEYHLPLGTFLGMAALMVVYAVPWIDNPVAPGFRYFRP